MREEFPEAVIMRPTDMFGDGDNFLHYYLSMSKCKVLIYWESAPVLAKGTCTSKVHMYWESAHVLTECTCTNGVSTPALEGLVSPVPPVHVHFLCQNILAEHCEWAYTPG